MPACRTIQDMMHREVTIPVQPLRIISLVPSQTELLYDLGLGETVVGITKFCIHPESWLRSKPRVGGTKQVHIDRVAALRPDLIIGNKEENERSQIEELAARYPVWMSDIHTIEEALTMIRSVGRLVHKEKEADSIAARIEAGFRTLPVTAPKEVVYFIWRNPWMGAGQDTFIHHMIETIGWQNALAGRQRYPELSLDELSLLRPDLVLLSSEPYPFREKHIAEIRSVLPDAHILLVDGEMFSWYGSRMLHAPDYFRSLLAAIS